MSAEQITALVAAVTGLLTAVGAVVGVVRHGRNPAKHNNAGPKP